MCPSGTEHFLWLFSIGWAKPHAPFQRLFGSLSLPPILFPSLTLNFFPFFNFNFIFFVTLKFLFSSFQHETLSLSYLNNNYHVLNPLLGIVLSTLTDFILFYSVLTTIL